MNDMLNYFYDLEYLLHRVDHLRNRNLLCVYRNPETTPSPQVGSPTFEFEGYDLVDTYGGPSALTNCGGFPRAYANSELSPHGLLSTLDRAKEVQAALLRKYPEEHHADCHVWALFRAVGAERLVLPDKR